ncbi:DUF2267 domain-containing protein [Actinomadura sp. 3N407]|uniref:DUF2267 domain-containing protein n=1 Tax=Actinomadura sp. 3N407 TaxID=3457423 RepID=UPI003FCEC21D
MTVKYTELVEFVSRHAGVDTGGARAAAEATVAALANTLDEPERDRFMDALPGEVKGPLPADGPSRRSSQGEFVRAVSQLADRPPEEARLRAHAVLAALADQDPGLIADLNVPDDLRDLFTPPAAGGGLTGPGGHTAPLTADEVDAALTALPEWSGDTRELRRTIVLPPGDLDRVLERIRLIRDETDRGPEIRRGTDGVELAVRTASVGAVTALDIDLAVRLDELIDEVGPGMASP